MGFLSKKELGSSSNNYNANSFTELYGISHIFGVVKNPLYNGREIVIIHYTGVKIKTVTIKPTGGPHARSIGRLFFGSPIPFILP